MVGVVRGIRDSCVVGLKPLKLGLLMGLLKLGLLKLGLLKLGMLKLGLLKLGLLKLGLLKLGLGLGWVKRAWPREGLHRLHGRCECEW